ALGRGARAINFPCCVRVMRLEERDDLFTFLDRSLRFLSFDKRACFLKKLERLRVFVGISGSRASTLTVDGGREAQGKSKDKSKPGNHSRYYACGLAGISSRLDNARHSFHFSCFPAFLIHRFFSRAEICSHWQRLGRRAARR